MSSAMWTNLFRPSASPEAELTALLLATPLFEGIPRRDVVRLINALHARDYAAGEYIFRTGERGAGAVLIRQGDVSIRSGNTELAQLGAGDLLGEIALAVDEPRTADAVAITPVSLVFVLRLDIEEWIDRAPAQGARLALNLARVIARRLRHANQLLTDRESENS